MTETMRMLTMTVLTALTFLTAKASHSPTTIRFCNRGYCYTKKEAEHHHGLDKPSSLVISPSEAIKINRQRQRMKRAIEVNAKYQGVGNGLELCTDSHGSTIDCELFEILGLDPDEIDAEYEALECVGKKCTGEAHYKEQEELTTEEIFSRPNDGEIIELDNLPRENSEQQKGRISWRDRPQRGKCFDSDQGYTFDCNLVKILDDDSVLIEDVSIGVYAAKPKTVFSTRRSKKNTNMFKNKGTKTPDVLRGSVYDPSEDWRTNVLLNLEGF